MDTKNLSRQNFDLIPQEGGEKKKGHKFLKIFLALIGIVVLLVVLLVSLPWLLGLVYRDIPPFDDSDLQLQTIRIPESDNAYYDIIKIKEDYSRASGEEIQQYVGGEEWDETIVLDILERNKVALELFDTAVQKPKYQDPGTDSPEKINPTTVISGLSQLRYGAKVNALKAEYLFRQGQEEQAFEEVFKVMEMGQKVNASQGHLIQYLVALAVENIASEKILDFIQQTQLPPETHITYAQRLAEYKSSAEGLKIALKSEYTMASGAIDTLSSGAYTSEDGFLEINLNDDILKGSQNSFYFQPNKTKLLFADYVRQEVENVDKPCSLITSVVPQTLIIEPWKRYFTENIIGKLLQDIIAVSYSGLHTGRCHDELLVSANQAMLAVKVFHNESGDYPVSLQELVPKYLVAVPQDPFDGNDLRYSKEKKIIYSVGDDGIDSGGSKGDDRWSMKDPTFEIQF